MFRRASLLVVLVFSLFSLYAQTERGSIRGTISDPSGASVGRAKVTATDVATGVATTTYSTEAGNYNVPELPPATYNVQVQATGFRTLTQENVVVQVSSVAALDLQLQVGSISENVTVTAAAPILQSETSDVNTTVSPKAYSDLPLTSSGGGRQPQGFMFLAPGVSAGGNSASNTFDAHVNGSQTLSTELQIDGMTSQTAEVQGDPRNLTFPPDAIEEMSVTTSSYSAQFGNTGGGVEQFVVKSGTNGFHGNLYEFLRNDVLDARGFFNATRSPHRENEFGFSVGGPVIIPKVYNGKNRTFFFTDFNWYKLRAGAQNAIGSVPDAAFRSGNLSGLVDSNGKQIQIYDPNTTTALPGGGFTRAPFANNQIPLNRISPVSLKILQYVPAPTLSGIYNNYPGTGGSIDNYRDWIAKVDQYLGSKQHFSATWIEGWRPDNGPYSILPHPVESSRDGNFWVKTARFNYDWTISPTLLNSFRVGFNRQHQLLAATETNTNYGDLVGISGMNNGFPAVSWGAFTPLAQNQDRIEPVSNTFLYADTVSWTKDKHNLKFGIDFRRLQHNGRYPNRDAYYSFSPLETAFPSGPLKSTTGNEFASFLLGQVDGASEYINSVVVGERTNYAGLYALDDWKITPKLTLNLGLRWDVYTPYEEVENRYSIMDPAVPNPAAGGIPGAYVYAGGTKGTPPFTGQNRLTTNSNTDWRNFAPRLGLAWKVTNREVIRAGYGISFYPNGGLGGGNITSVSDGYSTQANFTSLDSGVHPAFVWDNGFPQTYPHPPTISAGLNVGNSANMWWDNASKPMYKQDYNFTEETQLTSTLILDLAYVGSKATRLVTGTVNPDQLNPSYLGLGSLLQDNITDPAVVAAGFKPPYPGFTGSLAQALRPFPQYIGVGTENSANIGNSTYNSLQTKLEKRFSQGLWLLASYTWSKTITDSNSTLGGFFSTGARDNYNRRLEKALAVFDVPSRLTVGFNYELPIGPGKPVLNTGIASKILGGWQVNGILTYQSGNPIQISANNTLPLFNGANTPNSVAGQSAVRSCSGFDPGSGLLLNSAAFTLPATNQIGTSAQVLPNARNCPVYNEDLGVMKRFFINERTFFEFRFEMFNAFNRVVFGSPAANVNNSNFGQVTSQGNAPRNGQVALKFVF